jgi:hypothetical protein
VDGLNIFRNKEETMPGYFLLQRGATGKFSFDLKSGNHETLLSSEPYQSKDAAVDGVAAVQRHAAEDARFERIRAGNGPAYFLLKASNAEVIGRSVMYSSPSAMEHGIASVKACGGATEVRDLA